MIGYISDNLLLPILDFFYGLVPSYGLAIIALTLVIRLALFPLSAGSIRSARRMRIAQPVMQKRQAEIKAKYASNPQKQQEELGKLMKEFGSPLAGCLPLVVQMPILFALFATLRGSPFADLPYTLNLKVLPADQIAAVETKPFNSPSHSIFVTATSHVPVIATLEKGTKLGVGDTETVDLHTREGSSFASVLKGVENGDAYAPSWSVTKGEGIVSVDANGTINALAWLPVAASCSSRPSARWASTPMGRSTGISRFWWRPLAPACSCPRSSRAWACRPTPSSPRPTRSRR